MLMILLFLLQSQPVPLWLYPKEGKKCAFLLPPCLVVIPCLDSYVGLCWQPYDSCVVRGLGALLGRLI